MQSRPAPAHDIRRRMLGLAGGVAVVVGGLWGGGALEAFGKGAPRFAWAVSGGGALSDDADGIGSDPRGNLVISGGFAGTSRVDSSHAVTSAGGADVFAVGYGPRGKVRWAKRFGAGGADQAFDNDVDTRGDGVLTGSFNGRVDFGGPVLGSRGATLPATATPFCSSSVRADRPSGSARSAGAPRTAVTRCSWDRGTASS